MTKAEEILASAERFARDAGYNGFSFRDIAAEVGIKSASVHYHFPTKGDLGAALVRRYADHFFNELGDASDLAYPSHTLIERFVGAFRNSLVVDGQMCLGGLFGAEIAGLPDEVGSEARLFFTRCVDWLDAAHARASRGAIGEGTPPDDRALTLIATLEGALILARTLRDQAVFDRVAASAVPGWRPPIR
jgi:TetR/AcrR family transcriptional repressor of nem operon